MTGPSGPQSTAGDRQLQWGFSRPTYAGGRCTCGAIVQLDMTAAYNANDPTECKECGMKTPRLRLITEGLAQVDSVAWSLMSSDIHCYDAVELAPGETSRYDTSNLRIAKWLHTEIRHDMRHFFRYQIAVQFLESVAFVSITDRETWKPPEDPLPRLSGCLVPVRDIEPGKRPGVAPVALQCSNAVGQPPVGICRSERSWL